MADPSNGVSHQPADGTAQGSARSGAASTPKPRGRKRRRSFLAAVVAVALWAAGQGLGWFGSGPSGEQGASDGNGRSGSPAANIGSGVAGNAGQDDRDATPETAPAGTPQTRVAGAAEAGGNETAAGPGTANKAERPVAPADETTPDAASATGSSGTAGGSPSPGTGETVSADRFASLLSLLESHLQAGELGNASAALQRLRAQRLSDAQQQKLAGLEQRLQPLAAACELRVLDLVRSGELLEADREAAQLVVGGVLRADRLTTAADGLGLAANWQAGIAKDRQDLPAAAPLLRNRKVRVRFRDQLRDGVVASSNRDEVTVRIVTARGKTFPTVKAIACEPADSTSSEAIEMGLAAVHAGAPRLARLWLLRAHLLKDELTTRGNQLLEMLR